MVPYIGWECPMCKSGNKIARGRCLQCGRKKPEELVLKTFFKSETSTGHIKKKKKKKV